jgi:hypothetical protein
MEDNGDVFSEANFEAVMTKIKKGASAFNSVQEYAIALIRKLDRNGSGFAKFNEFNEGLQ